MLRILSVILLALLATASRADTAIIESFEDTSDPASWQAITSATVQQPNYGQTLNATVTGPVPVFVSASGNTVGRFTATWSDAPTTATNPYEVGGTTAYRAVRYNINAPSSLPNNAIPTSTGHLEADVTNNSADTVQVALVVDSTESSQFERGPLLQIPGNSSATYVWDFATSAPVGYVTGDGHFSGAIQRLKSLLVYSPTAAPTTSATLSLDVDNIRQVSVDDITAPQTPEPLTLQGVSTGTVILQWSPSPDSDVAWYRIYRSDDSHFGVPVANHLTFPNDPETTVPASQHSVTLNGLPAGQNIYFALTAVDSAVPPNESGLSMALGVNLSANGHLQKNLIVLDNDAILPGQPGFFSQGYAHAVVYTAQAFAALNRPFDSVTADAIVNHLASLSPDPQGIVAWSNLQDGITPGSSISPAAQVAISDYLSAAGNLIVSGSAVAQDLGTSTTVLQTLFKTQLQSSNIGVASIDPAGPLSSAPNFSTTLNPMNNAVAYATSANDGLLPVDGSISLATYSGVAASSAIAATGYRGSLVFLGFAFETAGSQAGPVASAVVRQNLMDAMITYLLGQSSAADWQLFD